MNGDYLQFLDQYKDVPPEQRPDWPLPSMDARDWATAFCKVMPEADYELMVAWFANAIMRGYDSGCQSEAQRVDSYLEQIRSQMPYYLAYLVSRNKQPDMSGDPLKCLHPGQRRDLDDTVHTLMTDVIEPILRRRS